MYKTQLGDPFAKQKIAVYDTEKKLKIDEVESIDETAKKYGLKPTTICDAVKRKSVNRTNNLGLKLAFRHAK